jgi:tryptophan 2,3-dioxygenase
MLFIIVHQAYELWFKQILHELTDIQQVMAQPHINERQLGTVIARLERIHQIQNVMVQQLGILETMTPLDFLDFRDYLIPASGFQSIQFKEIEIRLGLKSSQRVNFDQQSFYSRLNETDRNFLVALEQQESLHDHVENWLTRIPFISTAEFDFWKAYRLAVDTMLAQEKTIVTGHPNLSENERQFQLREIGNIAHTFDCILDSGQYEELRSKGQFRFSQRALLASIFINLYRDEPILHLPFRLLTALVQLDENFTMWRYRHVQMVRRMIGAKIGTGGSSGGDYLRSTTENNHFFRDLTLLATFLLPRSALPKLPESLKAALDFNANRRS